MSLFVAIEGIEGSGKSTLRSALADHYQRLSIETVLTHEPGATALGKFIRQIVLDPESKDLAPLSEVLLFGADRAQHLKEIIRPALNRGALVICDRFVHSTLAYQGYGRGMDLSELMRLQRFICGETMPSVVLLLDLPVEVGLTRARKRPAADWNRFEEQEQDFHRRVREGFLTLAKDPQQRIVVLDATQSAEEIAKQAVAAIKRMSSGN